MLTNSLIKRAVLRAGVCSAALAFGLVHAETMDYSTLEQIFGESVTTSATGQPQRASDVPANMVIITQDDIRRSGADNIPDILRYYTGIDVETNGVNTSDVGIRGFNQPANPHLLVLIDGREVYLDDYGWVDWGTLPVALNSIRQIEVVKGPNSALFGFNAVSGVINIITYDPLLDDVNSATFAGGTQTLKEGYGIATYHPAANIGLRLTAGVQKLRDFDPVAGYLSWQGFVEAAAKWRVEGNLILGAEISFQDSKGTNITPTSTLIDPSVRTNSIRFTAEDETPIGSLAANVYRNRLNFNVGSNGLAWPNTKWVGQISDTKKLDADNVVRVALEVRDNSLSNQSVVGGTIGYRNVAPSAMWNWQIRPGLTFTNAFRTDFLALRRSGSVPSGQDYTLATYNATHIVGYSYNSGIVYKPTDSDTIRLMASRGLQLPSLINYSFVLGSGSSAITGSPYVQPAVMSNYEIDYDRHLDVLKGTAGIALFHERLDDIIAGPFGTPTNQSGNFGNALENGVEFNVKGQAIHNVHYRASYTYTSGSDHTAVEPADETPLGTIDYEHSTPQSVVTLALGTALGQWEIDGAMRYQTAIQEVGSNVANIPSFVSTQFRVGYSPIENLTLAVSVQQALTPDLQETAHEKVGRRVIGSVTGHF